MPGAQIIRPGDSSRRIFYRSKLPLEGGDGCRSPLSAADPSMSALLPKGDIRQRKRHVRFVPKADILAAVHNAAIRSGFRNFEIEGSFALRGVTAGRLPAPSCL